MVLWCDVEKGRYSVGGQLVGAAGAHAHASVLRLCALVFVGDKSRWLLGQFPIVRGRSFEPSCLLRALLPVTTVPILDMRL